MLRDGFGEGQRRSQRLGAGCEDGEDGEVGGLWAECAVGGIGGGAHH